jgi:hypothetical protein
MKYETHLTDIANYDRVFTYSWAYNNWDDQNKFGDTWVPAGVDAFVKCAARVRESLNVLKHDFDSGKVTIHNIWDVSEYAKKIGKFKMHSKVDTSIGDKVGLRVDGSADLYNLSPAEMAIRVNMELSKMGQPLKRCGLTSWQYRGTLQTIGAFENGAKVVLADMCARSGKTLYIGACVVEMMKPITVIASYSLTSFTSFHCDFSGFEQFKDLVIVDSKDDDYKKQIKIARAAGKKVVVFLSLCKGGIAKNKRADRIEFLFGMQEEVLLVVDEADYGAWRVGQCDPLIKNVRDGDLVILMTGTNADRAVGGWNVDAVVQVTYIEMLMEKKETQEESKKAA